MTNVIQDKRRTGQTLDSTNVVQDKHKTEKRRTG